MAVVINELEMAPVEASPPAAAPEPPAPKPGLDVVELALAMRQHAERLARVRAD